LARRKGFVLPEGGCLMIEFVDRFTGIKIDKNQA